MIVHKSIDCFCWQLLDGMDTGTAEQADILFNPESRSTVNDDPIFSFTILTGDT